MWHGTKWIGVCAMAVVLAVTGCSPQADSADPRPVAPPAAGDPAGPAPIGEPVPPSRLAVQPDEPPTAAPSPTLQPPPPTATTTGIVPETTAAPTTDAGLETVTVATATPLPSPTPMPALRRLTTGGCCTQPFWSPDSRRVLFIDKPAPDAPVGIWGVDVTQPDPTPELAAERIGFYTTDMAFLVELNGDTTIIERLPDPATGKGGGRWMVPAGGRPVSLSPRRKRIAWQVSNDAPFERRMTQVWVANLDGTNARQVANLPRGSFAGWISDDVLLLSSRETLQSREQVLRTLSLIDGATVELVRSERLRGGLLSPDGRWLAYYVALSDEPAENGAWLVRTDGTERRQLGRELFGAYQWRDSRRLLIIPFRPAAVSHELWEFDVETSESRRVTEPAIAPFKVANGDWQVSPDGRYVAFVESRDRNIWVLDLG